MYFPFCSQMGKGNGKYQNMPAKRLLIIHQGALGDFVLTFPALIKLKAVYQQIDVLCQGKLGKIARELDLVDNWYALESAAFASLYADHFTRVDSRVKNILQGYDQIILFSYSWQLEKTLNHISGYKVCRIPPRPPEPEKIHVSEFIIKHLKNAHLLAGDEAVRTPFLQKTRTGDRCREKPVPASVLLHPGSGSRKKNWPLPNFLKLVEMLRSEGWHPEFMLGPAESDLTQQLAETAPGDMTVHIVSELEQVLELMNQADGIIGNDSGICQLAAFSGFSTVAIFGPSDPDKWRPMGKSVAIVQSDLDCSPCMETDKNNCDTLECLRSITPERVLTEFSKLIRCQ
jgi:ADP-heptose:LPS heptosyltransferase